jgi:predicted RNA-binding Zn-ribbon protein involved in translation (DUF1610 family)
MCGKLLLGTHIPTDDGPICTKCFLKLDKSEQERINSAAEKRIAKKAESNVPTCPKCGSTSLTANKKGFGVGKAVVGGLIAGPIGLAAGGIGSKKVRITCLNCGHDWIAGKG